MCGELRRVGSRSISIVDKELLSDFPQKWDLADSIPSGMDVKNLEDLLLRSKEKKLDVDQVLVGMGLNISEMDQKELATHRARANDVLFRVEERLWGSLDAKFQSKTSEIKNEIYLETVRISLHEKKIIEILEKDFMIAKEDSKNISHKMTLSIAESGVFLDRDSVKKVALSSGFVGKTNQDLSKIYERNPEITNQKNLEKTSEKEISI